MRLSGCISILKIYTNPIRVKTLTFSTINNDAAVNQGWSEASVKPFHLVPI